MSKQLIIGSRGSALALIQAEQVKDKLLALDANLSIEIRVIKTEGDLDQTSKLSELGGKSVFVKQIEKELVAGTIDIAVHSLKDITAQLETGTELAAFLKPESQKDCLILAKDKRIDELHELPNDFSIATSSLRRKLLLQSINPSWTIKDIRGNVDTRLKKIKDGYADAIILSEAGLIRLQKEPLIHLSLNPHAFVPAPGQGVVAVQVNSSNKKILKKVSAINDSDQALLSETELAIVNNIGLDCNYPLGLFAWTNGSQLFAKAFWGNRDCSKHFSDYQYVHLSYKDELIASLSKRIKSKLDA